MSEPDESAGSAGRSRRALVIGAAVLAVAAVVVVLLVVLGGSDDSDKEQPAASSAPEDASVDDFCTAFSQVDPTDEESSDAELVDGAKETATRLREVGTPADIGETERAGFEAYVDALTLIDTAQVKALRTATTQDQFFAAIRLDPTESADVLAFATWASTTCSES